MPEQEHAVSLLGLVFGKPVRDGEPFLGFGLVPEGSNGFQTRGLGGDGGEDRWKMEGVLEVGVGLDASPGNTGHGPLDVIWGGQGVDEVPQGPGPGPDAVQGDDGGPDGPLGGLPEVGGAGVGFGGDDEGGQILGGRISGDVLGDVPRNRPIVNGVEVVNVVFGNPLFTQLRGKRSLSKPI